jgi:endonuclease-3
LPRLAARGYPGRALASRPRARTTREGAAARRARAARLARRLAEAYPDARLALRWRTPFQLLVATILSAQCTDKKVNEVTRELFREHGTPAALASADPAEIERIVRPTGFYRQKAKAILSVAADLVERFGGRVPRTLEELVTLRGVARKTASVVLGEAFGEPALAVDTHMIRVNRRLALTAHDDRAKIERDLAALLPPAEWTGWTLRVIHHGRVCCTARAPRCDACPLRPDCPWPASAAARAARPTRRSARQ